MSDNKSLALKLVEAAAYLASRAEGDWSVYVNSYTPSVTLTQHFYESYDSDKEDSLTAAEQMNTVRKSIGGTWDKEVTDYNYSLTQEITPGLTVRLIATRDAVCEPKVIGQETVEVIDYDNAPKKTITKDIVEYDCHPILK